jgi:hypothetical protein
MPPYPVVCQSPGCGAAATLKVAAEWSDGVTAELKTYALCCEACVAKWLDTAKDHHRLCRLAEGESLSEPNVYDRGPPFTLRADFR